MVGGITDSAPLFAALGDTTRLGLLARLSQDGPRSITGLAAGSDVTRQAITQHLEVLRKAGLVKDVRLGRERIFEVELQKLEDARRCIDEISRGWDNALERLRLLVEESTDPV
jgi:DNA-binding transcriptional ArsR family regulator